MSCNKCPKKTCHRDHPWLLTLIVRVLYIIGIADNLSFILFVLNTTASVSSSVTLHQDNIYLYSISNRFGYRGFSLHFHIPNSLSANCKSALNVSKRRNMSSFWWDLMIRGAAKNMRFQQLCIVKYALSN